MSLVLETLQGCCKFRAATCTVCNGWFRVQLFKLGLEVQILSGKCVYFPCCSPLFQRLKVDYEIRREKAINNVRHAVSGATAGLENDRTEQRRKL